VLVDRLNLAGQKDGGVAESVLIVGLHKNRVRIIEVVQPATARDYKHRGDLNDRGLRVNDHARPAASLNVVIFVTRRRQVDPDYRSALEDTRSLSTSVRAP
jgi:hypothetical protein